MSTTGLQFEIRWIGLGLVLGCAVNACDGSNRQPLLEHPLEELVVRSVTLGPAVSRRSEDVANVELPPAINRIKQASEIARIGTLEGDEHEMFGQIEDAVFDARRGALAVLDARYFQLRWYDSSGSFIGAVGQAGDGPGEFRYAMAVDIGSDGSVYVGDAPQTIEVFSPTKDNPSFVEGLPLEILLQDFCMLNDVIYASGWRVPGEPGRAPPVLFRMATNGSLLSEPFGRFYKTEHLAAWRYMSDVLVACVQNAEMIVTLSRYLPEIRGYSVEGELLWATPIAEYVPWVLEEQSNSGIYMHISEEGAYSGVQITTLDNSLALVQIQEFTYAEFVRSRQRVAVHSYIFEVQSGKGYYIGAHLPEVVAASDSRLIGMVEDPFPQIVVFGLSEDGR